MGKVKHSTVFNLDVAMEVLVVNCESLRFLGIGGLNNKVSMNDLDKLKSFYKLESLDLRGCPDFIFSTIIDDEFTGEELAILKMLPRLKVLNGRDRDYKKVPSDIDQSSVDQESKDSAELLDSDDEQYFNVGSDLRDKIGTFKA